ncbi:RNA-binding domain-containing protein [Conidiobolus coronatus NRRL 28638]|uniref:RNA-binding domain-containing protein n=1 Tax=Conidiobolus coronatus (strain ATCC 28846 / CBS 209.66 / NRRL 28638) TaxID=796925 RepID=A0A137P005_CONC2|nr:RNA-binding domain-containing protein [Conidiobolus coronatus NRRL 28638]|eukprot:KXN68251.1 RNA-binding domain-containing protein [Conidiobolus coronatus NRRL 28638]
MSTRVYFGRLNRDVRERDIEKLLRGYGDIREINLKNGFGFVEFRDIKDADDVVYDFNGREFFGDRLIVEHARGRRDRFEERPRERFHSTRFGPPTRTQYRLIVENLSSSVSWQDLKDHMRKAGEVTFADCHKYREGEGIVEFVNQDALKEAVKTLDNTELRGRRITVREDEARGRRQDSRSPRRRDSRSPRRDRGNDDDRRRRDSRSPSPREDNRREDRDRHREDEHSPREEPARSPNDREQAPADEE